MGLLEVVTTTAFLWHVITGISENLFKPSAVAIQAWELLASGRSPRRICTKSSALICDFFFLELSLLARFGLLRRSAFFILSFDVEITSFN